MSHPEFSLLGKFGMLVYEYSVKAIVAGDFSRPKDLMFRKADESAHYKSFVVLKEAPNYLHVR